MSWKEDFNYWYDLGYELQDELFLEEDNYFNSHKNHDKEISKHTYALSVIEKMLKSAKTERLYDVFLKQIKEELNKIEEIESFYTNYRHEYERKEELKDDAFFIANAIRRYNS